MTPRRRSCSLCKRHEATSRALHLVGILIDGMPRRACDRCRATYSVVWHCQNCGSEQGGHRYERDGLAFCLECLAKVEAHVAPDA